MCVFKKQPAHAAAKLKVVKRRATGQVVFIEIWVSRTGCMEEIRGFRFPFKLILTKL